MLAFAHLYLLALVPAQDLEQFPPSPFDEVRSLELTAADPVLIDGRGPTAVVELEVGFSGTLHLWTRSELDLCLRVEDAADGRLLAEDEDSGGGNVPYLRREVEEGARLAVLIASRDGDALGLLELHVVAAPETAATLEAARVAEERLAEARRLLEEGDRGAARSRIDELVAELLSTPGSEFSQEVAQACPGIGKLAFAVSALDAARALQEAMLAAQERMLPEDHPEILSIRDSLGLTLCNQGDLPGARALQEGVLAVYERTLPGDDSRLLGVRHGLANTMRLQGDSAGARALYESVLEACERTLPEDHPNLLATRSNLAGVLLDQGDVTGARALLESVLASSRFPEDHPQLIPTRAMLAETMRRQGDLSGARAAYEAVIAACERTLPADHPNLLGLRGDLAIVLERIGDASGARALEESALAALERTLPPDHPHLLNTRINVALSRAWMDDLRGARALIGSQVAGMRAHVLGSLALAPRQAREAVEDEAGRLAKALLLTRDAGSELQASVFELQETMRMVVGESARALRGAEDPEVRGILEQAGAVSAALGDLASSSSERAPAELSAELTRLVQERDRLEREASTRLAAQGTVMGAIELGPLARSLTEDAALVAFRRMMQWGDDMGLDQQMGSDHLLAHVLAPDGSLVRIDLGEASELEELVTQWRAAVGAPLLRGVAAAEPGGDREPAAGEALRGRLLDPVLAVLGGGVKRLHVCADDLVYLVPLDALPWEEGRVGDRWSLVNEVSCARLIAPERAEKGGKSLLALGGVDYDAGEESASSDGASSGTRSAMPDEFSKLLQTRFEAETTGALAEDLLEVEPVVLTRKDATKAALFAQASGKRFLHLATHGWFADEGLKSTLDEEPGSRGSTSMSIEQRVTGLAPMLLCGLALAGANRPIDSLGRRPGILTAEELCSLDLSACDLAVLSACETNVGIRRAGQGIQSLQAALYAAGARSSITSLWKVDDAATRHLMELFYTKLWEEEVPKSRALWEAKQALRDEGAPVRDWAGWVLTCDPE
jgi:CHAT domain-containing protein/tetratricopeptide (TPR) repeat protein